MTHSLTAILKRTLLATAALALLPAAPALAWWDTGHMITAQIGYDNLRPEVKAKADKLVAWLDNTEPDAKRHHFVPVSVWMDETKARGLNAFNEWHYINLPYNPEGLAKTKDALDTNIVMVMESMAATLKNPKASDFEKAFALRILLHTFGDIHQPYHAVGRASHEHPDGDLGGNRTLISREGMKNIHAFWDSTAELYEQVSPPDWQGKIPGFAAEVQKKYPKADWEQMMAFNPKGWAEESYKLAVKYGYQPMEDSLNNLTQNQKLDETYVRNAQRVCEERLAMGGYRLAALLNESL